MKNIIETLYNHDQEVLEVYEEWAGCKKSIEALITNQSDSDKKLETARNNKKTLEMELKNLELDLGGLEAEISKCNQQKLSVTSEKSLHLIEDKILKVSEKKDEIELLWLEKSENFTPQLRLIEILEAEGGSKKEEKESDIPKLNEKLIESQKKLKLLIEERLDLMNGLSESLVKAYEKLRVKNLFQPVIFHLDESSCPKCGMHIRNVDFEMIRYHNEIIPCENCGTIIYNA